MNPHVIRDIFVSSIKRNLYSHGEVFNVTKIRDPLRDDRFINLGRSDSLNNQVRYLLNMLIRASGHILELIIKEMDML
jgi:hypothetical protein